MTSNRIPRSALKPALAVLLAPLLAQLAHGAPPTPDAGSILQQVSPAKPPAPSPSGTGLTIEPERGTKLPPSAPFEVKRILISGNTLFDTATLHALVADAEGKKLTLTQLNELAARITDHYHGQGYPLARAFIPAQTIRDGVARIEIIEARYGKIKLDNSSRVNDPLLEATLSPLQSGQVVGQAEMDRALLLLSDVPGTEVTATLRPGEAVGTSDLLVGVTPGPSLSAHAGLDNYGNRYTGRARLSGMVNFINPLRHGDVLSLSGITSGGDLNYGRLGYEWLLNGRGTRVGGAYSSLRYSLGGSLSNLNSHGTADVESLWARQPLVRRTDINLYGKLQYDRTKLRDHIDATALRTDRTVTNWTASLAGDARDALLSGGFTIWSVAWTGGEVGFDDPPAQASDAATAKTQGGFSKWNVSLARLQRLSHKNTVYLAVSGQWANDNLDSSQKMIAGGPYTVRAYDMGVISGDSGYLGTAEFRHDLGAARYGQWQAVAFVDSARIMVNKTTWTAGANSATLSGAGLGLNWTGPSLWSAGAYVATRIGQTPELVGSADSSRGWVEIGRSF